MAQATVSTVEQQLQFGIGAFVLARTVPVLDLDKMTGGTGVLVNLGNHFSVATAKHVIEGHSRYAVLLRDYNHTLTDFVAKHVDPREDVGIFELNPGAIGILLDVGQLFLSKDYIYTGRYPHPQSRICVAGFPGQPEMRVRTSKRMSRNTVLHEIAYRSFSFDTVALSRYEWPTVDFSVRRKQNALFCSWDPDLDQLTRFSLLDHFEAAKCCHLDNLSLRGMSGGGIWVTSPKSRGRIATPEARLVGIQSMWPKDGKGKWLRGTRTRALMRLIERHYPGIKA